MGSASTFDTPERTATGDRLGGIPSGRTMGAGTPSKVP
jgi:hypothetical protein